MFFFDRLSTLVKNSFPEIAKATRVCLLDAHYAGNFLYVECFPHVPVQILSETSFNILSPRFLKYIFESLYLSTHLFILQRRRERKRDTDIDGREKCQYPSYQLSRNQTLTRGMCPNLEGDLQPLGAPDRVPTMSHEAKAKLVCDGFEIRAR